MTRIITRHGVFALIGGSALAVTARADDVANAVDHRDRLGAHFDKSGNTVTGVFLTPKASGDGLKEMKALPNLRRLCYIGRQVTDADAKQIAALTKVEDLELLSTRITDTGLKDIAEMANLKTLHLTSMQVSDAGLKELGKLT